MPTFNCFSGTATSGVGGGLGAGSGGGGDHQGLDALLGASGGVQQLLDTVFIGHQDAGQLGGIHDAATAHGHNEIGAACLALVHQLLGFGVSGLRRKVIQDHGIHTALLHPGHGRFQQPCSSDSLIGEDRQVLYLVFFQYPADIFQGIFPAENAVGHLQIVFRKHEISSFCIVPAPVSFASLHSRSASPKPPDLEMM